ncbi:hypothetical protein NDN08_003258 [Rhodosorus marinus]|uniref:DUF726 domain-containing protein n=1 Tax=Rhodosorus marinus TaxID=101924 RepID=A0AAV8UW07_9RHOD|nr:hypothetical protein NDN08_003258 [Rhodosorus marinus]
MEAGQPTELCSGKESSEDARDFVDFVDFGDSYSEDGRSAPVSARSGTAHLVSSNLLDEEAVPGSENARLQYEYGGHSSSTSGETGSEKGAFLFLDSRKPIPGPSNAPPRSSSALDLFGTGHEDGYSASGAGSESDEWGDLQRAETMRSLRSNDADVVGAELLAQADQEKSDDVKNAMSMWQNFIGENPLNSEDWGTFEDASSTHSNSNLSDNTEEDARDLENGGQEGSIQAMADRIRAGLSDEERYFLGSLTCTLLEIDSDDGVVAKFSREFARNVLDVLSLSEPNKEVLLNMNLESNHLVGEHLNQCKDVIQNDGSRFICIQVLLLISLSNGEYDARCRALLFKVASTFDIQWRRVAAVELAIATHLYAIAEELAKQEKEMQSEMQNEIDQEAQQLEKAYRDKRRRKRRLRRAAKVSGIAIAGGLMFGVTGGLIAPALLASLAGIGVAGAATLAATGTVASGAAVGGLFGAFGSGIAGSKARKRTQLSVSEFDFERKGDPRIAAAKAKRAAKIEARTKRREATEQRNEVKENKTADVTEGGGDSGQDEMLAHKKKKKKRNWKRKKGKRRDRDLEDLGGSSDEDKAEMDRIDQAAQQALLEANAKESSIALHTCLCVPGWLVSRYFGSALDQFKLGLELTVPCSEHVALRWETKRLVQMARAFAKFWASKATVTTVQQVYPHVLGAASAVAGAVAAAIAFPLTVISAMDYIDNPWSVLVSRANGAGEQLADVLVERGYGKRPLTLVGYSLGARVVFKCLESLAKRGARGIVDSAFLIGAPVSGESERWKLIKQAVASRLVNGYCSTDWHLAFFHRTTNPGVKIAGLSRILLEDVESINLSFIGVRSHRDLQASMVRIFVSLGVGSGCVTMPPATILTTEQHMKRKRAAAEMDDIDDFSDDSLSYWEEKAMRDLDQRADHFDKKATGVGEGQTLLYTENNDDEDFWTWNGDFTIQGDIPDGSSSQRDFRSPEVVGTGKSNATVSSTASSNAFSVDLSKKKKSKSWWWNKKKSSSSMRSKSSNDRDSFDSVPPDFELDGNRKASSRSAEGADAEKNHGAIVLAEAEGDVQEDSEDPNRLAMGIGIEVTGRRVEEVFSKEESFPCRAHRLFTNCSENQRAMSIRLLETDKRRTPLAWADMTVSKTINGTRVLGEVFVKWENRFAPGKLRFLTNAEIDADGGIKVIIEEKRFLRIRKELLIEKGKLLTWEELAELETERKKREAEKEDAKDGKKDVEKQQDAGVELSANDDAAPEEPAKLISFSESSKGEQSQNATQGEQLLISLDGETQGDRRDANLNLQSVLIDFSDEPRHKLVTFDRENDGLVDNSMGAIPGGPQPEHENIQAIRGGVDALVLEGGPSTLTHEQPGGEAAFTRPPVSVKDDQSNRGASSVPLPERKGPQSSETTGDEVLLPSQPEGGNKPPRRADLLLDEDRKEPGSMQEDPGPSSQQDFLCDKSDMKQSASDLVKFSVSADYSDETLMSWDTKGSDSRHS